MRYFIEALNQSGEEISFPIVADNEREAVCLVNKILGMLIFRISKHLIQI
jgi:hypothetical protein